MLKFLRKYNKIILVVGGSLLMVAFLAPQAIQQLGKVSNRTIATHEGKKVKERAFYEAADELRAVNALGGTGGTANALLQLSQESGADADLHWYLLCKEAEAGGFVGSDLDGRSYYPALAQQIAVLSIRTSQQYQNIARQVGTQAADQFVLQQQLPERIEYWNDRLVQTENNAASSGRFSQIEDLHRAVAKLRGIERMRSAYSRVPRPSGRRVRSIGSEVFRGIETDYVQIPASRLIGEVAEPTEDEILAHFEEYSETNLFENEFGIGYLQPQRVKLEWLRLDRASFLTAIEIPLVDISKRWQLERDTYTGEFSEEQDRIKAVLEDERVTRLIEDAEIVIRGEMLGATRTLEREGDYYVLPDNWSESQPSLESIAQAVVDRLRDRSGVEIPLPAVTRLAAEWQDSSEINQLPGFTFATVRVGSQNAPAAAAILQIRELNPNQNLPIQIGILAAEHPARASDGSLIFYRVLDARDVSAPDSIDEVREQVVTDIKSLRGYERLQTVLPGYLDVAKAAGLDAMIDTLNEGLSEGDTNRLAIVADTNLSTVPQQGTPPVFADQDVLDGLWAFGETIDPTVEPEEIPAEQRTYSLLAPRQLSAVIGRVDRVLPLTTEDYRVMFDQAAQAVTIREISELDVATSPYTLERLIERHNWQPTQKRSSDTNAATDAADTEAPASDEPAAEDSAEDAEPTEG